MWRCFFKWNVKSSRLFTFEIFLANCIWILFNLKSVTLNVWRTEDLTAELLWGVVRSPADYLNKPSLNPKIFTSQWQAHAWFESVTQSQPRCQTNNFQETCSVSWKLQWRRQTRQVQPDRPWSAFLSSSRESASDRGRWAGLSSPTPWWLMIHLSKNISILYPEIILLQVSWLFLKQISPVFCI